MSVIFYLKELKRITILPLDRTPVAGRAFPNEPCSGASLQHGNSVCCKLLRCNSLQSLSRSKRCSLVSLNVALSTLKDSLSRCVFVKIPLMLRLFRRPTDFQSRTVSVTSSTLSSVSARSSPLDHSKRTLSAASRKTKPSVACASTSLPALTHSCT